MSESERVAEERTRQRGHQLNAQAVADTSDDNDAPVTLEYVSEVDDGPDLDDDTLDYQLSKVISTANLEEGQVDALEWRNEIYALLRRRVHPPRHGLTGDIRAYAFDDPTEALQPLSGKDVIKQEAQGVLSQFAASRSKDGYLVDVATKKVTESYVGGDRSSGRSIMDRIRRR